MDSKKIKSILAKKMHDEGAYFTEKDVKIKRHKNGYTITIKDYEHCPFKVYMEAEDGFYLTTVYYNEECIYFFDSKRKFTEEDAIIRIGYYIGTRF